MESDYASMSSWVRAPQQARSHASLERILEAGSVLFNTKGFDETTVTDIVAAAGTSVGSFYQRFESKENLLHTLHEHWCANFLASIEQAFAASPDGAPDEIVSAYVNILEEHFERIRGLVRTFLLVGFRSQIMRARTDEVLMMFSERMVADLCRQSGQPPARLREKSTRIVYIAHTVLVGRILAWPDRDPPLPVVGDFSCDLSRMLTSYLCQE